jgi:hypothetical protein
MPTTVVTPPRRVDAHELRIVSARPTQSKAWSAPASLGEARTCLGELARGLEHVGRAERARELELVGGAVDDDDLTRRRPGRRPCTTDRPTPPRPTTSTDWPSRTRAVFRTAPTPVMTAQPTRAACSSGTASGTGRTARSDTTVCSAKPPVDRPG